jgi:hypothetical protein
MLHMVDIDIKRGTWKVIRVDGTEELKKGKPTLDLIYKAIGCECMDTVCLRNKWDRSDDQILMAVDDTGMVDGKPVNPKATELYHSVCKPNPIYSIHGDVAICNDEDFAGG